MKNHPISIRFSSSEIDWLEKESSRRRQTVSEILRQALQQKMQNASFENGISAIDGRLDSLEKSLDQIGNLIVAEFEQLKKGATR
jgi:Ser-tRNA(Ala) deacylase AlaX